MNIQINLNILSIGRWLIIYKPTHCLQGTIVFYLLFISKFLSLSSRLLFISRELSAKATIALTNKDQQSRSTTINIGSIEFLYTTHHTLSSRATSMCPSLSHSYELYLSIYLLYFSHSYSYLSVEVICFVGFPFLSKVHLQADVWSSGPHIIASTLCTRLDKSKDLWKEELYNIFWAYHCSPQTTTNETPYRLTNGTDAMIPIELEEPSTRTLLFQQQQNEENVRVELETTEEV